MKKLIFAAVMLSLSGVALAAMPEGYINANLITVADQQRNYGYVWDPIRFLYYFIDQQDRRHRRHYMPRDWRHPDHGRNGDPRRDWERRHRHDHRHG